MFGLSERTKNILGSVLEHGATGLGTKTTNIAGMLNRPDVEPDTHIRHRESYRVDEKLGEELNDMIIDWAKKRASMKVIWTICASATFDAM